MDVKTFFCTLAAITFAFVPSPAVLRAAESAPIQQQLVSIGDHINQLASDIDAGHESHTELSERIDDLVDRIEEMLDAEAANKAYLIELRRLTLDLRLKLMGNNVVNDNGTMLIATSVPSAAGGNGTDLGPSGDVITVGHTTGGPFSDFGGGAFGGGHGGNGGLTIGSLGGMAALAAAIAIPIAVSGKGGGDNASPSGSP